VLRRRPISLEEIKTVEPYIHKVLSTIIKLDMSLELNTRSIYEYGTSYDYYMYIIDEYRKLGGYKFTLGSDAHHKDYLQYKFPEMVSVLKEMGINEIYYYKQRKPVRVKL
jgi:histidinol-phosphatase (PHP family)